MSLWRLYRTTTVLSLMSKVTDLREVGIGVSLCGSLEETDLYFYWKKKFCSCHSPARAETLLLQQCYSCPKAAIVFALTQTCSCNSPARASVLLLNPCFQRPAPVAVLLPPQSCPVVLLLLCTEEVLLLPQSSSCGDSCNSVTPAPKLP
ncbi:hypothetical protein WMY93_029118 [Mugilogobius chulae]|uniref:Uncharacterized protein n=1 Tax=Mugilogobius chulae TaxID=88201 RepID=A0AAW0MUG8_9GOBI